MSDTDETPYTVTLASQAIDPNDLADLLARFGATHGDPTIACDDDIGPPLQFSLWHAKLTREMILVTEESKAALERLRGEPNRATKALGCAALLVETFQRISDTLNKAAEARQ